MCLILFFFIANLAGRTECICLNDETLKSLVKEAPLTTRIKVLRDLCLKVSDSRLENVNIAFLC